MTGSTGLFLRIIANSDAIGRVSCALRGFTVKGARVRAAGVPVREPPPRTFSLVPKQGGGPTWAGVPPLSGGHWLLTSQM